MDSSNKAQVQEFAERIATAIKLASLKSDVTLDPKRREEEVKAQHADNIRKIVAKVRSARPAGLAAFTSGRARRSLEVEIRQAWALAWNSYANFIGTILPEQLQDLVAEAPDVKSDLAKHAVEQFKALVLPRLRETSDGGDAIFLLVTELVSNPPRAQVVDAIVHRRPAPANSFELYYGLFGLVLQAEECHRLEKRDAAYSCLLDAQQLIGIAAGARSILREFPKSSAKRRALENSMKRWSKEDANRLLLLGLYYSMKKTDSSGKPLPWKSPEDAAYAMQDAVVEDSGLSEMPESGPFSYEKVLRDSKRLFEAEAAGLSLDIQGIAACSDDGLA